MSLHIWVLLSLSTGVFSLVSASLTKSLHDEALFLTPHIESGQIQEAQKLATVPPMLQGAESFAGYLTVNKSCNSNVFFWLHKSQQEYWEDRPLLVWLEGGFGSSIIGMFAEIGPFSVKEKKRAKNTMFVRRKPGAGSARGESATLKKRDISKTRSWEAQNEEESASREVHEEAETDLRVEHVEAESASWGVNNEAETDLRVENVETESPSQKEHKETESLLRVKHVEANFASSTGPEIQRPKYAWNEDFQLQRRKYAWNRKYNLVFIDSPVGTGFSFTETGSGYAKNTADATRDLLEVLTQLYKLFPALQKNKLFFLGSCFGGKLAVATAHKLYKLHETSTTSETRQVVPVPAGLIELAVTLEPFHITRYGISRYLNNVGLLDQQQLHDFILKEQEVRAAARAGNFTEAFRIWFAGLERVKELTGFGHVLDITQDHLGAGSHMPALQFVNRTEVRRAIHVGSYELSQGAIAKSHMTPDFLQSIKPELEELLTQAPFPIIFLTGQLDMMATYEMASDLFTSLEWPYAMDYSKARRCQFKVGNRIAAYYKTAGSLTNVLVRNVGHWIATAHPRWTFELMETFIENRTSFQCA